MPDTRRVMYSGGTRKFVVLLSAVDDFQASIEVPVKCMVHYVRTGMKTYITKAYFWNDGSAKWLPVDACTEQGKLLYRLIDAQFASIDKYQQYNLDALASAKHEAYKQTLTY